MCIRSHENTSSRLDFPSALGVQDCRPARFCDHEDHLYVALSNDRTVSCGGVGLARFIDTIIFQILLMLVTLFIPKIRMPLFESTVDFLGPSGKTRA
ncbi:hypothetical protein B5K05_33760 [Rhizobium phaseoli]|nr:hypothetical protein B5K05_33760 [Rhizobium phaseoli]RDJ00905.1 hypothetical protein B5K04_31070 [Rhizobium phaseoli]